MHSEMQAVLVGLLVIALASLVILFAMNMKKKAGVESRYTFISAHAEVPAPRQA
jgi:hypothetical protein